MAQMTRNCTVFAAPALLSDSPSLASLGSGSRPRFIVPGNIYATWRDTNGRGGGGGGQTDVVQLAPKCTLNFAEEAMQQQQQVDPSSEKLVWLRLPPLLSRVRTKITFAVLFVQS